MARIWKLNKKTNLEKIFTPQKRDLDCIYSRTIEQFDKEALGRVFIIKNELN